VIEAPRCAVVTCRGRCVGRQFWCPRHAEAVTLAELCMVAVARNASRRWRLHVIEVISTRLEPLNRQQLRARAREVDRHRKVLSKTS
jgi:hypothetical protein